MAVYLVSREPAGREIAHRDESSAGAFLCTKEFADQYSLMHYRRGGEKTGVRRWQNEDGSYTPEGYKHYAEMYGWGKFRADRAEKKAEKYEDKAKKAEAELHKQQARVDKAQVKVDRKRNDKNVQKAQVATNKLHEAQLRFDQYRNKAEKYQNKADRIHEKWDQKQERLDKYLNEDGTLNEKAMAKYTYSNGVQSKMNLAGRLKFGSKFAEEFDKQQLDAAKKRGDTDRAKVNAESDKLIDQDYADRKLAREVEERVENNELREGGLAGRKEGSESDVTPAVARLLKNGQSVEDRDFRYTLYNGVNTIGFDSGSAEFRRDFGDLALYYLNNFDPNDRKSGATSVDKEGYNHVKREVVEEIDRVAGNENAGEYKPGSNGEKAHNALMESYDKSWARRNQVAKENGINQTKLDHGSDRAKAKEYEKLKKALSSDKIYQALEENDKKNEDALLSAILKDLGFSDTSSNRSAIYPIVFRD